MSDIYSDDELTDVSSYHSDDNNDSIDNSDNIDSDDSIQNCDLMKEETEYFSKDENIILGKILNFHDESKFILSKNSNYIKLDIIGSIDSTINQVDDNSKSNIHISIIISIIDEEEKGIKRVNLR